MSTTIQQVEHSPMGEFFTNNIESSGCGVQELHEVFTCVTYTKILYKILTVFQ